MLRGLISFGASDDRQFISRFTEREPRSTGEGLMSQRNFTTKARRTLRKIPRSRHCEESTGMAYGHPEDRLRDEAIQTTGAWDSGLLRSARNDE
jgi:hypothetical protein